MMTIMIPTEFTDINQLPPPPKEWTDEIAAEELDLFQRCMTIKEFRQLIIPLAGFLVDGAKDTLLRNLMTPDQFYNKTWVTNAGYRFGYPPRPSGDLRPSIYKYTLDHNRNNTCHMIDTNIVNLPQGRTAGFWECETAWLVPKGKKNGYRYNLHCVPRHIHGTTIEGTKDKTRLTGSYGPLHTIQMGNRIFKQNRGKHDLQFIKTLATKTKGAVSKKKLETYWEAQRAWKITKQKPASHIRHAGDKWLPGFAWAMLERYGNILKIPNLSKELFDWETHSNDYSPTGSYYYLTCIQTGDPANQIGIGLDRFAEILANN